MPNRLVSIAILIGWAYASLALFRRDILPDLLIGPPPDLRSIARAQQAKSLPTRWAILVADDDDAMNLRAVGQVESRSVLARDGWYRLSSYAWFDSSELLKGTPLASLGQERVEIRSVVEVDKGGNLETFRVAIQVAGEPGELLVLAGKVHGNDLIVTTQGSIPLLNWTKRYGYKPRQMVQNELSPLDLLPGLQVGQRWREQVVSPLTGRVEQASVVVERRRVITWDSNPVTTLEVVTQVAPMTARTWVRPDGLVLRQEVPFPFVRLILERLPDRFIGPSARVRNLSP